MGSGIAQVAATAGCSVKIYDTNQEALSKSKSALEKTLTMLLDKGKIAAMGSHDELVKTSEIYRSLLAEGVRKAAAGPGPQPQPQGVPPGKNAPPGGMPPGGMPPGGMPPGPKPPM